MDGDKTVAPELQAKTRSSCQLCISIQLRGAVTIRLALRPNCAFRLLPQDIVKKFIQENPPICCQRFHLVANETHCKAKLVLSVDNKLLTRNCSTWNISSKEPAGDSCTGSQREPSSQTLDNKQLKSKCSTWNIFANFRQGLRSRIAPAPVKL